MTAAEIVTRRSIRDALGIAASELAAAGCETPMLDAELLLGSVLECDRAKLILRAREPLAAARQARFDELLARRAAREPVAYITGAKAFRRLTLSVDPRVLIPRPETELLVEVGLTLPERARVADVGTGCGAVALALKDERPDLAVVGLDISSDALVVAERNAARLALDASFERADLLAGGPYDAVLANLPYVSRGCELPPEISVYEPEIALFAGADGLVTIGRLIGRLEGVRTVALEIGFDQAREVARLIESAGFGDVARLRDLTGHERVIVGRR
jgi:release factor glutamine methyltransferase